MRRATIVQTALVVELALLVLALLVGGGMPRREVPARTMTYRPATVEERQQAEADRLSALLDEIAARRALSAPPVFRGL